MLFIAAAGSSSQIAISDDLASFAISRKIALQTSGLRWYDT